MEEGWRDQYTNSVFARAVLGLKKQRDQLKQHQKKITLVLEKDRELAKQLLQVVL